jgi:hypothetical protein
MGQEYLRAEEGDIKPCNLASFFWRGVSFLFMPENAYGVVSVRR